MGQYAEINEISFYIDQEDGPGWEILFTVLPFTDCFDVCINSAGRVEWWGRYCGVVSLPAAEGIWKWFCTGAEGVLPAGFVIPAQDADMGETAAIGP
jgi:hypothetical protein